MLCVYWEKGGNRRRQPSRLEAQGKSESLFGQVIAYIKRRVERKEERARSAVRAPLSAALVRRRCTSRVVGPC